MQEALFDVVQFSFIYFVSIKQFCSEGFSNVHKLYYYYCTMYTSILVCASCNFMVLYCVPQIIVIMA